ncbi:antA/AntB antirepressor family protein [Paenalcaligenes hermetiae]|uniref:AntA/AntB antirepressor domain-containing protein n=1 Tax=Paenalcaligenes hermetiae TaxID=1157987 RepID=A0ABP9MBT0_9BURK
MTNFTIRVESTQNKQCFERLLPKGVWLADTAPQPQRQQIGRRKMSSLIKQDGGFVGSRARGNQMGALLNLSPREIGGELIQTVDARELHAFLEVGRDFHTWLADRIEQYSFYPM